MRTILFMTGDVDAGFQITPTPPTPDLQPGESCVDKIWPQYEIELARIITRDGYEITRLLVGVEIIELAKCVESRRTVWRPRAAGAIAPIRVLAGQKIELELRNDAGKPVRPVSGVLLEDPYAY